MVSVPCSCPSALFSSMLQMVSNQPKHGVGGGGGILKLFILGLAGKETKTNTHKKIAPSMKDSHW